MQSLDSPEFAEFHKEIFKEHQKILVGLVLIHLGGTSRLLLDFCQTHGVSIEVLDQNGGGKGGLVMEATAPIGMATCTDFL